MKLIYLIAFFSFIASLGFCQSFKTESKDEKIIVAVKENKKYGITATFYGVNFRSGEDDEKTDKLIKNIVFRENKTGAEITYSPTGTESAADFYFTDIWSPDEEYAVLPIGKPEGFAIFESKNIVANVKSSKYFDSIKVKHENSGWFWHDFEKWEDDSTFAFKAGLDGDMFAFKYNVAKQELYCYQNKCADSDVGANAKGEIKPTEKGVIEPTKIH